MNAVLSYRIKNMELIVPKTLNYTRILALSILKWIEYQLLMTTSKKPFGYLRSFMEKEAYILVKFIGKWVMCAASRKKKQPKPTMKRL